MENSLKFQEPLLSPQITRKNQATGQVWASACSWLTLLPGALTSTSRTFEAVRAHLQTEAS